MLQETQNRQAIEDSNRCRMWFALVLLFAALIAVLVREHAYWFGTEQPAVSEAAEPGDAVVPAPSSQPVQDVPHISVPVSNSEPKKHSEPAQPQADESSMVTTDRAVLPPLQAEVVTDRTRHAIQPNHNPLNINLQPDPVLEPAVGQPMPATAVQQASLSVKVPTSYPSLSAKMKVQGSVLLQALVSAEGVIQELRVISGPAILSEAARQAALQWHFKPYYENGKAVETQARITVNFVIKVWDDSALDQQNARKKSPLTITRQGNPGE